MKSAILTPLLSDGDTMYLNYVMLANTLGMWAHPVVEPERLLIRSFIYGTKQGESINAARELAGLTGKNHEICRDEIKRHKLPKEMWRKGNLLLGFLKCDSEKIYTMAVDFLRKETGDITHYSFKHIASLKGWQKSKNAIKILNGRNIKGYEIFTGSLWQYGMQDLVVLFKKAK
jgi:hypothetical protein